MDNNFKEAGLVMKHQRCTENCIDGCLGKMIKNINAFNTEQVFGHFH